MIPSTTMDFSEKILCGCFQHYLMLCPMFGHLVIAQWWYPASRISHKFNTWPWQYIDVLSGKWQHWHCSKKTDNMHHTSNTHKCNKITRVSGPRELPKAAIFEVCTKWCIAQNSSNKVRKQCVWRSWSNMSKLASITQVGVDGLRSLFSSFNCLTD